MKLFIGNWQSSKSEQFVQEDKWSQWAFFLDPLAVFNIDLGVDSSSSWSCRFYMKLSMLRDAIPKVISSVEMLVEWTSEKASNWNLVCIITARRSNVLHMHGTKIQGIWWMSMSYSLTWFVKPIFHKILHQVSKLRLFIFYRYILVGNMPYRKL